MGELDQLGLEPRLGPARARHLDAEHVENLSHANAMEHRIANGDQGALARAWGGELGARVKPSENSRVAMDVWFLQLSSEQVWSGDAGGTEASDATRRFGLDIEGSTQLTIGHETASGSTTRRRPKSQGGCQGNGQLT